MIKNHNKIVGPLIHYKLNIKLLSQQMDPKFTNYYEIINKSNINNNL